MNKLRIAKKLLDVATIAVHLKEKAERQSRHIAVCKAVHLKQADDFEQSVLAALTPLFKRQIQDAVTNLRAFAPGDATSTSVQSSSIFNPTDYQKSLIQSILPPLAIAANKAMWAQQKLMLININKIRKGVRTAWLKVSTANQWFQDHDMQDTLDADLKSITFNTPVGPVTVGFATEMPQWMKDKTKELLEESFAQDYWNNINGTTATDIEDFLKTGIADGWSIDEMARNMANHLGGDTYALVRGRCIARTEAGNALNGARTATADHLIDTVGGKDLPMKKTWLSVLGPTTRAAHARLDGVPCDETGKWILDGYLCRWPADISLPAGQRANCQCTVVVEFGMTDEDADKLRNDYAERVIADQEAQAGKSFQVTQKADGVPVKYGCLMVEIPEPIAQQIKALGLERIPDSKVGEGGREDWPHVTIKYGFHTDDAHAVLGAVKATKPPEITIGKISEFKGFCPWIKKADGDSVVKLDIHSPDLHKMRAVVETFENTDVHQEYHPHCTLAYIKKGSPVELGAHALDGKSFIANKLVFSDASKNKHHMTLGDAWGDVDIRPACPKCGSLDTMHARTNGSGNTVCGACRHIFTDLNYGKKSALIDDELSGGMAANPPVFDGPKAEYCPHCGSRQERGDDGKCKRCGECRKSA